MGNLLGREDVPAAGSDVRVVCDAAFSSVIMKISSLLQRKPAGSEARHE